MKHDCVYLRHMLEAIEKIERNLAGTDFEAFSRNDVMIDSVIREPEVIGEAARNLSPAFVEEHAHVPWRRMAAMRNVLIPPCFGVNLKDEIRETRPVKQTLWDSGIRACQGCGRECHQGGVAR